MLVSFRIIENMLIFHLFHHINLSVESHSEICPVVTYLFIIGVTVLLFFFNSSYFWLNSNHGAWAYLGLFVEEISMKTHICEL